VGWACEAPLAVVLLLTSGVCACTVLFAACVPCCPRALTCTHTGIWLLTGRLESYLPPIAAGRHTVVAAGRGREGQALADTTALANNCSWWLLCGTGQVREPTGCSSMSAQVWFEGPTIILCCWFVRMSAVVVVNRGGCNPVTYMFWKFCLPSGHI
jgi:hypothetical protein